jgi:ribosomal protein S18 acetylase RimI-like enzyme
LSGPWPAPASGLASPPLLDTSPDGLARAIDADSVATRVLNGELPLEAHLDPDAAWAINPITDPYRSVVVAARFDERSADRRIAEIAASYAERATPFLWWRSPLDGPADLGARLERAGIWQVGDAPAMTVDLADLPAALDPPAGLEILEVTDVAGLREYLAVLVVEPPPDGAPPLFPPPVAAAIVAHTGARLALEPTPMRYVGRFEGRPVATSRLSLAGGAAGIYAVETLAEFRGRGIGRAMTLAPLLTARRLGYRIGTLQSTEAGFGVYRSIGFEEQFRYAIHIGGVPPGSIA